MHAECETVGGGEEVQTASSHALDDVAGVVKARRCHVEGQERLLDKPLLVRGLVVVVLLDCALARAAQDGVPDVRVVRAGQRLVEQRERAHHAHSLLVALLAVETRRLARQPAGVACQTLECHGCSAELGVVRVHGAERRLVLLVEELGHRVRRLQHALVRKSRHHHCCTGPTHTHTKCGCV